MKIQKIMGILCKTALLVAVIGLFVFLANSSDTEEDEEQESWSVEVNSEIRGETVTVADTDQFLLEFDETDGSLTITDYQTGIEWYTNPVSAEEDSVAFGTYKTNVRSQFIIEYYDSSVNRFTLNSYTGCVSEAKYHYSLQDDGILVVYDMEKAGFEIPIFYGIEDDHFVARVLCEEIVEYGDYTLGSITLLPYMGCGNQDDDGYLFVPDGSGSLIYFNNLKQSYTSYSEAVYGRDPALTSSEASALKETIRMPVFGICKNEYSMLAVITDGEYQATINAEVSGKNTENNVAYSTVTLQYKETSTLLANSSNETTSEMLSESYRNGNYEVSYYFLGEDTGYVDMALRYQQYLTEQGMEATDTEVSGIQLTWIGAVEKTDTILGIPYDTVEALTTFASLKEVMEELMEEGQFSYTMTGITKDGLTAKLPSKIVLESKLGGTSGFSDLVTYAEEEGIAFYPVFNLTDLNQTGNGYRKTAATRNVTRSASLQYTYLASTGAINEDISPTYLLSPRLMSDLVDKFLTSIEKKQITAFGVSGLSDTVYSDYRKNSVFRNDAGDIWEAAIQTIAQEAESLLTEDANAYAAIYSDVIGEVTVDSSYFDVEDECVPFYQIVFSGYADLYSEPVNMQGDTEEYLLKLASFGVRPNFLLVTEDASVLMNTEYAYLYAVDYDAWRDVILETSERFAQMETVYGQRIIGYEAVAENVYRTTFENGNAVYVNYGEKAVSVDGIRIDAKDFVVRTGD